MMMIKPGDPQFDEWNDRGMNQRFKGAPKGIVPVATIDELTDALQHTIDQQLRVVVRGGGHCLENFVCDPAVEVVIDLSRMKGIRYDPEKKAIEIMAGETVGDIHQTLFTNWGIVLPLGEHPDIGIGGHISCGAFGFLCRKFGLGADYLYAVEVLWVNKNRKVMRSIATREADDENRELWWAHTGGGTGNFGIVTRYWFRAQTATSNDPHTLLPTAPEAVDILEITWPWQVFEEATFAALVANFGKWIENNSGNGVIAREFFGTLILTNKTTGNILLQCVVADPAHTDFIIAEILKWVHPGPEIPHHLSRKKMTWLEFALRPFHSETAPQKISFKFKDAFLRKPFSGEQIKTIYHYLAFSPDTPGAAVGMASYGGKINEVPAGATSSAQRNCIFTTSGTPVWTDPAEADKYIAWARHCYRDLYADQGGLPVPGDQTAGCIIAHPDNDLADPAWNTTSVPWHHFYYLDGYPRLQQVKATWDPLNIFHHTLSVKLPESA